MGIERTAAYRHDVNGKGYYVCKVDRLQSWHQLHSITSFGVVDAAVDAHQHERVDMLDAFDTIFHKDYIVLYPTPTRYEFNCFLKRCNKRRRQY